MPIQSAHDRAVLGAILNPLFPEAIEEQLAAEESKAPKTPPNTPTAQEREIRQLEIEGMKEAEQQRYEAALELFNKAMALNPKRASCYNNRAQTHRLMLNTKEAIADLNQAISITAGQGKVAAQAFTQRAMIHRLEGRNEDAKTDFTLAAEQGCVFAKNQLIAMNPYAAMCNKMISQVIGQLQRGEDHETEMTG